MKFQVVVCMAAIVALPPFATPTVAQHARTLTLDGWVGAVAFSPNGKFLATGSSDNLARLWDVATGKELVSFRGHRDYVAAVAFSPDSKTLATGSYDHTARLWDLSSGKTRAELRGHRGGVMAVAFSPEGQMLATGSIDGDVKLWDAASGKLIKTLSGHKSWVNSLAFQPAGKLLASGSSDGTIGLWPLTDAEPKPSFLRATKAEVRCVAFSQGGKHLAAGLRYGKIKIWDAESRKELREIAGHEDDVWSMAFLPDDKGLVAGDGGWGRSGQVKLWQVATGRCTATFQHSGEVLSLAVSPNGQWLALPFDSDKAPCCTLLHLPTGDTVQLPTSNEARFVG